MLRSSQTYLVPDDVVVPCRVRHAGSATDADFSGIYDYSCTMRVWHKTTQQPSHEQSNSHRRSSSNSPFHAASSALRLPSSTINPGPELVLTPCNHALVTEQSQLQCCGSDFGNSFPTKFASFGGSASDQGNKLRLSRSHGNVRASMRESPHDDLCQLSLGTITIPMKEIMLIGVGNGEMATTKRPQHQTNITTVSSGFYELTMENLNGQLVLMAFLKGHLPKGKFRECFPNNPLLPRSPSNLTENTQSSKSFDVEAFTANRMAERLQSESVAEKVQRRIHRLVSSLEEMSSSITECGCGCVRPASVSPAPEKRDSPPMHMNGVELASENTSLQDSFNDDPRNNARFEMKPSSKYKKRQDTLRYSHLPSGLSVESDPETMSVSASVAAVAAPNHND